MLLAALARDGMLHALLVPAWQVPRRTPAKFEELAEALIVFGSAAPSRRSRRPGARPGADRVAAARAFFEHSPHAWACAAHLAEARCSSCLRDRRRPATVLRAGSTATAR
ncbi:MAG: hypothetical protein U0Z44_06775 [Kouleothrix sp.]